MFPISSPFFTLLEISHLVPAAGPLPATFATPSTVDVCIPLTPIFDMASYRFPLTQYPIPSCKMKVFFLLLLGFVRFGGSTVSTGTNCPTTLAAPPRRFWRFQPGWLFGCTAACNCTSGFTGTLCHGFGLISILGSPQGLCGRAPLRSNRLCNCRLVTKTYRPLLPLPTNQTEH